MPTDNLTYTTHPKRKDGLGVWLRALEHDAHAPLHPSWEFEHEELGNSPYSMLVNQ